MNTRGAVDIANVDQALYREDLGFKVTNAGYEEYKRGEGQFGKAYDDVIASNTSALEQNRAGLEAANKYISSSANESIDKWYNEASSKWKPVAVSYVNTSVQSGNYRLPAEVIPQLTEAGLYVTPRKWGYSQERKTYTWLESDAASADLIFVTPTIKGGGSGNSYPKEVNAAIANVQNQVKSAFYDAALPKYQELVTNVGKAQESKSQYEQYIKTSENTIAEAQQQKALRDTTKEAYKQQYTESKAARQALFAPLAKPEETL